MGRRTGWFIFIVLLVAIVVTSILVFLPGILFFLPTVTTLPFLLPLLFVLITLLAMVIFFQTRKSYSKGVHRAPLPRPRHRLEYIPKIDSPRTTQRGKTISPTEEKREALDVADAIQRQASLTYWERMRLEKVYDLIVSLHETGLKIKAPKGVTVKPFDRVYNIPRDGHVRIIPVCGSLNIAPVYRDVEVAAFEKETPAIFKLVPRAVGTYDLEVEFQFVRRDGRITKLGKEKTKVTIQEKDYELTVFGRTLRVSRKVPAFFSVCGGFFGFFSFVLPQMGFNPQEMVLTSVAAAGSGVVSILMIAWAAILLFKSLKPLKTLIPVTLGKS